MNPYLYALANPINVTDPDGLHPLLFGMAFEVSLQLGAHLLSRRPMCQFRVNWKRAVAGALLGWGIGGAISLLKKIQILKWRSFIKARSAKAEALLEKGGWYKEVNNVSGA